MVKKNLEIHSENILPIIKKWLYSDKDIFVRELVSNAVDAIYKVKLLRDQGLAEAKDEDFRIDIQINKADRTLKFTDTGIGMDAEEVQKYIAQIAFSGAEDFVAKYKTNNERDQFIGHFGLGFYSAYMVAEKVQIDTFSYKINAEPVLWVCDGSAEYTLEKGHRQVRGTEITLFLDKESEEYLDEHRLRKILEHYCAFLPYPIYLGGLHINKQEPLWIKSPSACTPEDYLKFYHHLFPMEEDPLFWVHLNVDYPFHLKGILYFPKMRRDADRGKNSVNLYCNRVFVSDNCKDIIPNYLMPLRGVIDSPDIPLNVSRSYLQMDRTVRQIGGHLSKKVADSLTALYRTDREKCIKSWPDISVVIKLGILEDEKFYDKSKEFLIWKNTAGEWTTVDEYLERNRDKTNNKIFYTKDEKHSTHVLEIYKNQGIEILCADSPFDPFIMQFLEKQLAPVIFQRVDASLDDSLLDKEREKTILDASGRTEAAKLADFVRLKLNNDNIKVEAKSLAADALPGFIMIDENQRRLRDYMLHLDPSDVENKLHLTEKKTFVINTNSPVMSSIQKIDEIDPELAADLVKQAFELSLLSQREMDPSSLNEFIARSTRVLEKMANFIKMIRKKIALTLIFFCLPLWLQGIVYDPLTVYLTWQQSPETTMMVHWISNQSRTEDIVEYQKKGDTRWLAVQGVHMAMPDQYPFFIHHAELTHLQPDTEYQFRTGRDAVIDKFRTMPDKMNKPIRFIVGGDIYHDGLDVLSKMNKQAAKLNPMFVLCGGDLAYNEEGPGVLPMLMPRWMDWLIAWNKQMVTEDGRLIPLIPVIGNHEVRRRYKLSQKNAIFYESLFAIKDHQEYNALDFGNYMTVIVLDSGHMHTVQGKQTQWLYQTLQKRKEIPYKFAIYHVAAFPSVRKFDERTKDLIRKYWVPLFEQFGVQNVFENHDHAYKRTYPIKSGRVDPKGIVYVGDGGWAVEFPRIPKDPKTTWYLAKTKSSRNIVYVTLHDNIRHFLAFDDEGRIIDEFIGKN